MSPGKVLKVVLDACVLYPAPLRDILLSFAANDLFIPHWSSQIHNEWIYNLLKNRTDLAIEKLISTKNAMNTAFPISNIEGYSHLIPTIPLSDEDDRHVVAVALKSSADRIITFNLRDFPLKALSKFELKAQHPDEFLVEIFNLYPKLSLDAFEHQVRRLTNPPMAREQVLLRLEKCGLLKITEKLKINE